MITFASPLVLIVFPLCICFYVVRYWRPHRWYFFPAVSLASDRPVAYPDLFRLLTILALVVALARPRSELQRVFHKVQGIDIELVLDVSGSMQLFDDHSTKKSRWIIAREEALQFIAKRSHDAVGIILFGAFAVSRCPLTQDKKMLSECIAKSELGEVNPEGTLLAGALMLAGSKLMHSKGKSKIIIALTDGAPSPHDVDAREALQFLKKEGIKVYTIGIGGDEGGFIEHPILGTVNVQSPLNASLLETIARETGGLFFRATQQNELAHIYSMIDELERADYEVPYTVLYKEYFIYFLWIAACAFAVELFLSWWLRWL